jgi:hypothetical protein
MPKPSLYARARRTLTAGLSLLVILLPGAFPFAAQAPHPPCAACLVFIADPGQSLLIPPSLNRVEVLVRTGPEPPPSDASVAASLQAIEDAGGRPGLLTDLAAALPPADLVARTHRIAVDLSGIGQADPDLVFRLKSRLTELRALRPGALLGVIGSAAVVGALLERDLGAYLDFVGRAGAAPPAFPPGLDARAVAASLHAVQARTAGGVEAGVEGWVLRLPADALDARRLLADVSRAAPLLPQGLVPGGTVPVRCDDRELETFLDPASLDTVALAGACDAPVAVAGEPAGTERIALSGGQVIVRVPAGEGRFAEGVRVVAARGLTVREVIARHQAAAARQRRAVRHLISTGRMTLTFEAPGFPAPLTISSQTVIFAAPDRVELEQRDIRVNGIAFGGSQVPRLPLIEPERVASPPLAIELSDRYRYQLHGTETVSGVTCYVVGFEPVDRRQTLFAGRAWIAGDTFAMVRVSAVQTGLRGPIVSSEQIDEFRPEGEALWLLDRSETRQIYEGPGHRTPIQRVLTIDRHEINPGAFEARVQAAYASPSIMLRDTPEGFRYLRREREEAGGAARVEPVVGGRSERVRTLIGGVIVDPNISRPLPFAGLSYVDFNLLGTGTQMNAFFGGTYGQLAVSVPSLGGTRWQLAGRAFGIASSYNDRAFVEGREIYEANISQRPAHASAWLMRPLTPRLSARAGYDFDYTHYGRSESTAQAFTVPVSQSAHAVRLALEAQWAGWAASGWWAGARRIGWREWGYQQTGAPGEYVPAHRDYQRFGGAVSRSVVFSPRLVGRVEGAWMGGHDLDRFSRYSFGSFDNRLRGYPSALIRYDRGAVLRTSAAWAAGRLLRIDGFFDVAHVRDPGFGRSAKPYVGIGSAVEVPAPFGTLLAVEWGYGFQGLDSDGQRGTQVLRISGYKMF